MNINLKFAKRLRNLRQAQGLTQAALADMADIDYKYLQKLESREPSSPTLEKLSRLAKALGMTVSELTKGL